MIVLMVVIEWCWCGVLWGDSGMCEDELDMVGMCVFRI